MFKFKYCALIIIIAVLFSDHVHSRIGTRILNGIKAKRNQFQFYAKLTITEMKVDMLLTSKHQCGGTLISKNAILTAGHCLKFDRPITVRARCGFYDANDDADQQQYISKQNIVHEKFNPKTFENDIGLVLLAMDVRFTSAVNVIPLGCEYTKPSTAVAAIGDGLLNSNDDELPSQLYWANLTTISNLGCSLLYDDIIPSVLCAMGIKGQATCHGDSGGPIVRNINGVTKLIALVSFGAVGNCGSGLPNGFTRVGSYASWIANHTTPSVICS